MMVTHRCNRICPFCFYTTGHLSYPAREMGEGELMKSLASLDSIGVRRLILTGGEPLLRGETIPLLRRAGELGMARLLLTNGDPFDDHLAAQVAACRIEGVTLSVNSLAEARRLDRCIPLLRNGGATWLTATIVFTGRNAREVDLLCEWARARAMGIILQPAFIPGGAVCLSEFSPHSLDDAGWSVLIPLLDRWAHDAGTTRYAEYIMALYGRGPGARPSSCGMGSDTLVLDADGMVYACFHRRDLAAGNILEEPPEAIAAKLRAAASRVCTAPCYGEHCVSLFCGHQSI
ncbi:MAG: radical SAM protein [Candidatus Aureabacteria bacterium]|nr:radical SAM protein [Candidatus Auribacterota bacterium]